MAKEKKKDSGDKVKKPKKKKTSAAEKLAAPVEKKATDIARETEAAAPRAKAIKAGAKPAKKKSAPASAPSIVSGLIGGVLSTASAAIGAVEDIVDVVIHPAEISLRAYFISERRRAAGAPGDEDSDWVEAERELKAEAAKRRRKA